MTAPMCPQCGAKAVRSTTRFGARYDCCGMWAWGENPLVDGETHEARRAAHAAFDPLWKSGLYRRGVAYQQLAAELGVPLQECHMKLMDAATARRVPSIVEELKRRNAAHG